MSDSFFSDWLYLPKSSIDEEAMRKRATLKGVNGQDNTTFNVKMWRSAGDHIAIPRMAPFITPMERAAAKDCTQRGFDAFVGVPPITLRPYQVEPVDQFTNFLLGNSGGVLLAAPGRGKTVMTLETVRRLGRTTLVVVHKEFLMEQWQERIDQHLSGAKVGFVQQDVCDYEGKDIVIAMVHSLIARRYDPQFYTYFGTVATDEVHRIAADTWSEAITKFPPAYRLGVTATPKRKDKLSNIFLWHIGPVVVTIKGQGMIPQIKQINWEGDYDLKAHIVYRRARDHKGVLRTVEKFNNAKFITTISKDPARNAALARLLARAVNSGRKVIALSERTDQLDVLMDLVCGMIDDSKTIGKYVGGMKPSERDLSATCDLILGTFQMAQEGLDIPELDTLFLLTPKGDIIQTVGRIQRELEGKSTPFVVDIVDTKVPYSCALGRKRSRQYTKVIGAEIL